MADLWSMPVLRRLIDPVRYAADRRLAFGIAAEAEMALTDARTKLADGSPVALRRSAAYAHDAVQLTAQSLMSLYGMKLQSGIGDHLRRDEFSVAVGLIAQADAAALNSLRIERNSVQYPADTSPPDREEMERWVDIVDGAVRVLFTGHLNVTRSVPHRPIPPPPKS